MRTHEPNDEFRLVGGYKYVSTRTPHMRETFETKTLQQYNVYDSCHKSTEQILFALFFISVKLRTLTTVSFVYQLSRIYLQFTTPK